MKQLKNRNIDLLPIKHLVNYVHTLLITVYIYIYINCRDTVDSKCTYNNGSDWVRGAVVGLVYSSAWMDCGNFYSLNIFLHHPLYLQSLSRVLQVWGHCQEKLYLHGCSQSQFRYFCCIPIHYSNFNLLQIMHIFVV